MKKLLEVQKEIGTLSKNAKNPFFKSQYLDLTTLIEHVTPLLNAQGLVLVQPIRGDSVHSIIYDAKDGGCIESSFITIPSSITDPQKLGGAITYFRRYTLKSLLAIAEVDDDGNLAAKPEPKVKEKLTDSGMKFLEAKGSLKQLEECLTTRTVTDVQRAAIDKLIKIFTDGTK